LKIEYIRFFQKEKRMILEKLKLSFVVVLLFVCLINPVFAKTIELIKNGGFENGGRYWDYGGDFHANSRFSNPRSGTGYAYVADNDGQPKNWATGHIKQTVDLPSNASSIGFEFYYSITSQESSNKLKDFITVFFNDADTGKPVASLLSIDNRDQDDSPGTYHRKSLNITKHKGKRITIEFLVITGPDKPTTFRIDDVSVKAIIEDEDEDDGPVPYINLKGICANQSTIDSQGSTNLEPDIDHNLENNIRYEWSCSAGSFSSKTSKNTTWRAPQNTSGHTKTYTITLEVYKVNHRKDVNDFADCTISVRSEEIEQPFINIINVNIGKSTIESGAQTSLEMVIDHNVNSLSYQWNCSVGSFSSRYSKSTTWTAPKNNTDNIKSYSITAKACSSNNNSVCDRQNCAIFVKPEPKQEPEEENYFIKITNVEASKTSVDSQGQVRLEVKVDHNVGNKLRYRWSAGGGSFSSAVSKSPIWYAPQNTSGQNRDYQLNVEAYKYDDRENINDVDSLTITVRSEQVEQQEPEEKEIEHKLEINYVNANQNPVKSGGQVILNASVDHMPENKQLSYDWTCSGGTLSLNSNYQAQWSAPENSTDYEKTYTVNFEVWETNNPNLKDSWTVTLRVLPKQEPAFIRIIAVEASKKQVDSGAQVNLQASVEHNLGNIAYKWSCVNGSFSSPYSKSTTWTAPDFSGNYSLMCEIKFDAYQPGTSLSDSESTTVFVALEPEIQPEITIHSINASTKNIPSGGTCDLSVNASHNQGNQLTYKWSSKTLYTNNIVFNAESFKESSNNEYYIGIEVEPIDSNGNTTTVNITFKNRTGAWYELVLNKETDYTVSDRKIPFAFILGPWQTRKFFDIELLNSPGLAFKMTANRASVASIAMMAIDLICRGLFNTPVPPEMAPEIAATKLERIGINIKNTYEKIEKDFKNNAGIKTILSDCNGFIAAAMGTYDLMKPFINDVLAIDIENHISEKTQEAVEEAINEIIDETVKGTVWEKVKERVDTLIDVYGRANQLYDLTVSTFKSPINDTVYIYAVQSNKFSDSGSFTNKNSQNTTWNAPINESESIETYELRVIVADSQNPDIARTQIIRVNVEPQGPALISMIKGPTAVPSKVACGGSVILLAHARHSEGKPLQYEWKGGHVGKFYEKNQSNDEYGSKIHWKPWPSKNGFNCTLTVVISEKGNRSVSIARQVVIQVEANPQPFLQMPFPAGMNLRLTQSSNCPENEGRYGTDCTHKKDFDIYAVDLASGATKKNAPITASASGKAYVFSEANSSGYGNLVQIDHGNGYFTIYAHLKKINVETDEFVTQGQVIGEEGNTGFSKGKHLHFGLIKGDASKPAFAPSYSVEIQSLYARDLGKNRTSLYDDEPFFRFYNGDDLIYYHYYESANEFIFKGFKKGEVGSAYLANSFIEPCKILQRSPENGETNVDRNTTITICFDRPFNLQKLEIEPAIAYNAKWSNGYEVELIPTKPLEKDAVYTLTIISEISSKYLSSTWSFNTGTNSTTLPIINPELPPTTDTNLVEFDLELETGLNFVYIPLKVEQVNGQDLQIEIVQDLKAIDNNIVAIFIFDKEISNWIQADQQKIISSTGIVIQSRKNFSLHLSGTKLDNRVELEKGLNLIGIPLQCDSMKFSEFYDLENSIISIYTYNPISGRYNLIKENSNDNKKIPIGESFFVFANQNCIIELPQNILAMPAKNTRPPIATVLLQNYPNPFNPETWIPFRLGQSSNVSIRIYNSKAQLVRKIELGHLPRGEYYVEEKAAYWDGRNSRGERVASGVYFYNIILLALAQAMALYNVLYGDLFYCSSF